MQVYLDFIKKEPINMYLKIRSRSFYLKDFYVLEEALQKFCQNLLETGLYDPKLSGAIPLPVQRKLLTVNRSVHADNKAREQYSLRIHKRLWVLYLKPLEGPHYDYTCTSQCKPFHKVWKEFAEDTLLNKGIALDWTFEEQ